MNGEKHTFTSIISLNAEPTKADYTKLLQYAFENIYEYGLVPTDFAVQFEEEIHHGSPYLSVKVTL
jgi:hypothetical protein